MKSSFHRWFLRYPADWWKNFRRQVRRAVFHPKLALDYQVFRRTIHRKDWNAAHEMLRPLAQLARETGDLRLVTEMGNAALRLSESELATELEVASARLRGQDPLEEWAGEDLSNITLAIHFKKSEKQGLADGMQMTGYVAEVSASAAHTILVVEQRLVPIYSRTFPEIEVVAYPASLEPKAGTKLVNIGGLALKVVLGSGPDEASKNGFNL